MIPRFGGWEWIIILVIVLLLFGPGALARFQAKSAKALENFAMD